MSKVVVSDQVDKGLLGDVLTIELTNKGGWADLLILPVYEGSGLGKICCSKLILSFCRASVFDGSSLEKGARNDINKAKSNLPRMIACGSNPPP